MDLNSILLAVATVVVIAEPLARRFLGARSPAAGKVAVMDNLITSILSVATGTHAPDERKRLAGLLRSVLAVLEVEDPKPQS